MRLRKRTSSDQYYAVMSDFLWGPHIMIRCNNLKNAIRYRNQRRSDEFYKDHNIWIEYVVKTEVRQPIEEDGTIKGRWDYA